jgi:uncharacterized protein (TIGR04222 family)
MNPLDLTGPEFLRFYIPYGLGVVALAWLVRALLGRASGALPSARWSPGAYPREGDAYAIAFLRGGRQEAVRTVLGRLVSAGLVQVESRLVWVLPEPGEGSPQLQPIERTAWSALQGEVPLTAMEAEQRIQGALLDPHLRDIEAELEREGLLPGPERKTPFRALAVVTWLAVVGLGLAKLGVAIARGRSNILFLILLLIIFWLLIARLLRTPRQTKAARQYLDWLQESHRGLVQMLGSGRRDSAGEMALAAGIYGLTEVPGLTPLGQAFQPVPAQRRNDSGSSSSSSGCGSGSSDSGGGGSSCGGGCGGGGCGGCGG